MRRLARGLRHCLREAWEGLSRNPALSLLSVVAIGISLYVLGLFLVVAVNLNRFVDALGRDVQVQIFLRDGASPAALRALRIALDADPAVEAARMVSAEEARRRFRDVFPTLADLSDGIGGDPFPASFDLTLRDGYRDPATVERVARSYEGVPGVEEVRFDLEWMERLAGIVALVRGGGVGIGLLLGLAMMVTIGAVIRLTVLARREEIEIMRLVGATGAFVRGPFLLAAAAQGTAGGGLALAALLLTHRMILGSEIARANPFVAIVVGRFLPAEAAVLLAAGGALLGLVSATLALRRTAVL